MNFVVTLLGRDRLGIVESFSSAVTDHGGTWCESRILQVDDQFAGVFHADLPPDNADRFESDLRAAFESDFTLAVARSTPDTEAAASWNRFEVRVLCSDRRGLLHDFARLCTAREINIQELQTNLKQAPMSGVKMFEIRAACQSASRIDPDTFSDDVEALGQDVVVDFFSESDGA